MIKKHKMQKMILSFVALVTLSAPVRGEPLLCLIEPDEMVDVGSPVIGILESVAVERGDHVRKGQVVARLTSQVEQRAVGVAALRARNEAELASARAAKDYTHRTEQRAELLVQKNFVSRQYLDQAATDASVAASKLNQAEENRRQADMELQLAKAQLELRTIRSPFSGVVMERYLSRGQRVEEQPIVKIAKIDPLRVEVIVPAQYYNKIKRGMTATVIPELPEAGSYTATVKIADQVIDAASNTFRVRLELPNPDQKLPAGARCKVDLISTVATSLQKNALTPQPQASTPMMGTKQQQPAQMTDRSDEVLKAVQTWAKAWSARDVAGYLAAYAKDFHPSGSQNFGAWAKTRRDRIMGATAIDVRIESPHVTFEGENRARVTFMQLYRSDRFQGDVLKALVLVYQGNRWVIQEERLGG